METNGSEVPRTTTNAASIREICLETHRGNDLLPIPPEYVLDDEHQKEKHSGSIDINDDHARSSDNPETLEDSKGASAPIPFRDRKAKIGELFDLSKSLTGKKNGVRPGACINKAIAPNPINTRDAGDKCTPGTKSIDPRTSDRSSHHYNEYIVKSHHSSSNGLSLTEEGLVVACPVKEEENNGSIYEATMYDSTSNTFLYKSTRCRVYTALSLLVASTIVALGVVFALKNRPVHDDKYLDQQAQSVTIKPTSYRESLGIQERIEDYALERNKRFQHMRATDPEYLALNWILHDDRMQLSIGAPNLLQRYILAVLAFSFDLYSWDCGMVNDIDSCNETYFDDYTLWLSQTNECLWYGVLCLKGKVISISLPSNNLIGTIPPEIRGLRLLESLSLRENCIYGTIPPELWTLTRLSDIDIEWNFLSGVVSSEMYELTSLARLKLAGNNSTESCNRTNGTHIYISSPGLQGEIFEPKIAQLSNLQEISVYANNFNGSISSEIGSLNGLEFIMADRNNITGSLPKEMSNLTSLKEVWLGENKITGSIPDSIDGMKSLEQLSIWGMSMSGTIPPSLYNLLNLKGLHLRNNDPGFEGPIRSEIGKLLQLEELILHDNPLLTGTLPSELGLCQNLKEIQIHNTQLTGTVPQEVCALRDKKLNLDNNWITYFFWADCSPNNETLPPYFDCDCCSTCCDHTTKVCLDQDKRT